MGPNVQKRAGGKAQGSASRAYQPIAREAALLVCELLRAKQAETGKPVTRARLGEGALRRLWCRGQLTPEFLTEVQEWMYRAGWVLFFARTNYAVIRLDVVDGWVRIASKRMAKTLQDVARGKYDFELLEDFFGADESATEDEPEAEGD